MMQGKIHPLYTNDFDLNASDVVDEKFRFSVCFHFIPRSGSNLLSDLLFQTKTLGVPLEYFSLSNLKYLLDRLGSFEAVINARTSECGCFSFKWNSNFQQIPVARQAYQILKPRYHIFIDRRDRMRQAESYAKAMKSKQWFQSVTTEPVLVEVDEKEVLSALGALNAIRNLTQKNIDRVGVDFLSVMYEDLIEDPQLWLGKIYDHCGVRRPPIFPKESMVLRPSSNFGSENF